MTDEHQLADRGFVSRMFRVETVITLAGMLVGFGVIYGTTLSRIESNAANIRELTVAAATDRQFSADQRVRLWDRVDKVEDQQARMLERLAAIEALMRQTNSMVERLLTLQLEARAEK